MGDIEQRRAQKQAFAQHLRDNMTWPERILWSRLRHKQIGYLFHAQEVKFGYILDFWCEEARVAIELDGAAHDCADAQDEDQRRDTLLTKTGIDVLRFPNWDIYHGLGAVLVRIWEHCHVRAPHNLRPFSKSLSRSRREETVEMQALSQVQAAKRLQQHEEAFSNRYMKKRSNWNPKKHERTAKGL